MVKVLKLKNSLAVVIPAQLARIKGLQAKQELLWQLDERSGKLTLDAVRL